MNFPINTTDRCAETLTTNYRKEGWGNFLGGGASLMLATAVVTAWEV